MADPIFNVTTTLNPDSIPSFKRDTFVWGNGQADNAVGFPRKLRASQGFTVKHTILQQDGSALDLSVYVTEKSLYVNAFEQGTAFTLLVAGVFVTDGTDGKINFTVPKDSIPLSIANFKRTTEGNAVLQVFLEGASTKFIMDHNLNIFDDDASSSGPGTVNGNDIFDFIFESAGTATDSPSAAVSKAVAIGDGAIAQSFARFAWAGEKLATVGDNQYTRQQAYIQTTDATPTELRVDNAATERITIPTDKLCGFVVRVSAREDATNDVRVDLFEGAIKNAAGTTSIVGSVTQTVFAEEAGTTAWVIALSADDSNDALAITVTGEAAHTINWVATVTFTEVA